jgi:hypothetical protein
VIRIKDLLRNGRTHLPELLLALDRINPLDLLAMRGLLLSGHKGGFDFEIKMTDLAGKGANTTEFLESGLQAVTAAPILIRTARCFFRKGNRYTATIKIAPVVAA